MASNKSYKYCIVPLCSNTTLTAPNKVFICVPTDPVKRKKWCMVMKRDDKKNKVLSNITNRHVCEDHFNLEEDLENYMRWKMIGGNMRLKKDVVPHIFQCQKHKELTYRETGEKRKRAQFVEEAVKEYDLNITSVSNEQPIELPSSAVDEVSQISDCSHKDKAVQVKICKKVRSKGTNTKSPNVSSKACSPLKKKQLMEPITTVGDILCNSDNEDLFSNMKNSDTEFVNEGYDTGSEYDAIEEEASKKKKNIRKEIISLIGNNSHLYLGVPQEMYFVIELLSTSIHAPVLNIIISLKKIRLDLSYDILGNQFGLSSSVICRIFKRTLPGMSYVLNQLITWPSKEEILTKLPIPFRARYDGVESIIDCFEVEIEKPGNPIHQALTWSDYKGCNTLKYLISCTPNGMVNFVSRGYGGRTTDSMIAEESGYLNNIKPGMMIMADRGFKNISHLLEREGAFLVRPSSVPKDTILSKSQIRESKSIAALRIIIERVIRRVREFNMLKMHSTIDRQLVTAVDHIVMIVCGLINLQTPLIKS